MLQGALCLISLANKMLWCQNALDASK